MLMLCNLAYRNECYSFVALVKSWRKEPGRAHDDHTATADDEACQVTSQRMESGSTQQGWSPCYPGREGWALFSLSRADSCPFRSLWSGLGGGSRARARLAQSPNGMCISKRRRRRPAGPSFCHSKDWPISQDTHD